VIFLIRHGETVGNASRTVQLPDSHVFVYREALTS